MLLGFAYLAFGAILLACDFFYLETIVPRRVYLLFFIEIGTRRFVASRAPRTPRNAGFIARQTPART